RIGNGGDEAFAGKFKILACIFWQGGFQRFQRLARCGGCIFRLFHDPSCPANGRLLLRGGYIAPGVREAIWAIALSEGRAHWQIRNSMSSSAPVFESGASASSKRMKVLPS